MFLTYEWRRADNIRSIGRNTQITQVINIENMEQSTESIQVKNEIVLENSRI